MSQATEGSTGALAVDNAPNPAASATVAAATVASPASEATATPNNAATAAPGSSPPASPAPSLDEVIASLPADAVARMTGAEMDKLIGGDAETLKRFGLAPAAAVPAAAAAPVQGEGESIAAAPNAAENVADATLKAVKRIHLGHLSLEDQRDVVDLVYAVKQGGAKTIREAIRSLGLAPSAEVKAAAEAAAAAPAPGATPTSETPAIPVPAAAPVAAVDDKVTALRAKITTLDADRKAALEDYDTGKAQDLLLELIDARAELREAERADALRLSELEGIAAKERDFTLQAEDLYAEQLATPQFAQALKDQIDLAEFRKDPALNSPDWPLRLCERTATILGVAAPSAAAPLRPVAPAIESRPKGAVAAPAGGMVSLSREEALQKARDLSEADTLALIREMNRIEAARRAA